MPEYNFNTNLGPAAQQGTSLGDMINTARGAQAFQQAEQLNPLALQKAQMEIEQAKKINPLAERRAGAEASTASDANSESTEATGATPTWVWAFAIVIAASAVWFITR
jgi:hypothetical protein